MPSEVFMPINSSARLSTDCTLSHFLMIATRADGASVSQLADASWMRNAAIGVRAG
jgi:hypothetical protein